jgi:hypothetical protein
MTALARKAAVAIQMSGPLAPSAKNRPSASGGAVKAEAAVELKQTTAAERSRHSHRRPRSLPLRRQSGSDVQSAALEQLQHSGRGRTRDCRSRDDFESGRRPALAAQQRSSKYGRVLAEDRPGCTQQAISTKGGRACFRPTARAAVTADGAADRAHPGWALPRHFRNPARFAGASLSAMPEHAIPAVSRWLGSASASIVATSLAARTKAALAARLLGLRRRALLSRPRRSDPIAA